MNNLITRKLTSLLRLSVCLLVVACIPSIAIAQRGGSGVALVPQRAVAIAKLNWNLVRSDAHSARCLMPISWTAPLTI